MPHPTHRFANTCSALPPIRAQADAHGLLLPEHCGICFRSPAGQACAVLFATMCSCFALAYRDVSSACSAAQDKIKPRPFLIGADKQTETRLSVWVERRVSIQHLAESRSGCFVHLQRVLDIEHVGTSH